MYFYPEGVASREGHQPLSIVFPPLKQKFTDNENVPVYEEKKGVSMVKNLDKQEKNKPPNISLLSCSIRIRLLSVGNWQVVVAVGDGAIAAITADKLLQEVG
jgi:hypothetical protein